MRRKSSLLSLSSLFFLILYLLYQLVGEMAWADNLMEDQSAYHPYTRRGVEMEIQKAFDLCGKIEVNHVLCGPDEMAAFYGLEYAQQTEKSSSADQFFFHLRGKHEGEKVNFFWKARTFLHKDDLGWQEASYADEAFVSLYHSPRLRWEAGKKNFRWGKSYAWNPLDFVTPARDPLDTDLPQEGFIYGGAQYTLKFPPGPDPIQEISFTPLIFPVQERINKSFGQLNHWNTAGKLSFLFWNTNIDICLLKGESRPERYGFAFSRYMHPSLEVYGDLWVIPEYEKVFLDSSGKLYSTIFASFGSLWGFCYDDGPDNKYRYIVEFYRNKAGFKSEEMLSYYNYLHEVIANYQETGDQTHLKRMMVFTQKYYNQPNLMQEYVYGKIIKKEPLEIQQLTFSLSGVYNLEDKSYSLSPQFSYKSSPHLSLKLKGVICEGDSLTEFGEKINDWTVEVSLTYLFDFSFYQIPSLKQSPGLKGPPAQEYFR